MSGLNGTAAAKSLGWKPPDGDKLTINCSPRDDRGQRLVVATLKGKDHRHKFDIDSQFHRRQFRDAVVDRFGLGEDAHEFIEQELFRRAGEQDESAAALGVATPRITTLADVTAKPVNWFWDIYMPRGSLVEIIGDPNEGKSQVAISIIARYSRGLTMPPASFPGGCTPGDSLILAAEDDLERTVVPRLAAQDADLSKIHHLRNVATPFGETPERLFQIPSDIPILEQLITSKSIGLVAIDVLSPFIEEGFNANSDGDMRRCLSPLSAMAERTQALVLLLRHMNKREGAKSMYRAGGSVAITAACRASFAVAPHPEDPEQKIFAAIKHNLGPKPPSLTYSIEPHGNVSRVVWGGQTELSVDDVLKAGGGDKSGGSKFEQAKTIILDILGAGARGSNEVEGAMDAAEISRPTYWRARKALGVKAEKCGFNDGQWLLSLPSHEEYQGDF